MKTRKTMLIADGYKSLFDAYHVIFEDFNLITTTDGKEAVNIFKNKKNLIDIILISNKISNMGGLEVIYELKQNQKTETPIIMVSGSDIRERALKAGATDYIQKPFTVNMIREKVGKYLKK